MEELVCGIDVGTSAVRVLISTLDGSVIANSSCPLKPVYARDKYRQQDVENWWEATLFALKGALVHTNPSSIRSLSVDATSGTIVLVDSALRPIGPGIMYNDARAEGYGDIINATAVDFIARHGYSFKDDFSLSKILWLARNDSNFGKAKKVLHQSDFINAKLTGEIPPTDWSNALKSGCDLINGGWPSFIFEKLGIPKEKLPDNVVAPGTIIGKISRAAANETGLSQETMVVAGASDGTAALFASGAHKPGDFSTSLGSTITIKGITEKILFDPRGTVYCHKHPAGFWLPGGASNVGCAAINKEFAPEPATRRQILACLDSAALKFFPCDTVLYPLADATSERFPFKKTSIRAFVAGTTACREELYAAMLQSIAFVERWCYEELNALGANVKQVYSVGGGSKSTVWRSIRADILRLPLIIPENVETALGAAMIAAAPIVGDFQKACAEMTRIREVISPGNDSRYEQLYRKFRNEVHQRWNV